MHTISAPFPTTRVLPSRTCSIIIGNLNLQDLKSRIFSTHIETSEEKRNLHVKSVTRPVVATGGYGTGNEEAGGGEQP